MKPAPVAQPLFHADLSSKGAVPVIDDASWLAFFKALSNAFLPPTLSGETSVLSAGPATVWTLINLSAVVPVNATWAWGTVENYTIAGLSYLASDSNGGGAIRTGGGSSTTSSPFLLPLRTPQALWYKTANSGSCYVYISGYWS